jgi:hypothetical protein
MSSQWHQSLSVRDSREASGLKTIPSSQRHRGQSCLASDTPRAVGRTLAQVGIEHLDLMPPKRSGPLDQGIWPTLTVLMVQDLLE